MAKQKVFLITGFNNCGKTYILGKIFNTKIFHKGEPEILADRQFMVMPQSNDDLGKARFEREYLKRLQIYSAKNGAPKYIAAAFCPTKEDKNDSISILRNLFPKSKVEMLLLEYKWCGQAKLLPAQIAQTYASERNLTIHTITPKDATKRTNHAIEVIRSCLP